LVENGGAVFAEFIRRETGVEKKREISGAVGGRWVGLGPADLPLYSSFHFLSAQCILFL
jgi:hypothetical protein